MKKLLSIILATTMLFSLTACYSSSASEAEPEVEAGIEAEVEVEAGIEVALVTDIGSIEDKSFNEGAWNGVLEFIETRDVTYAHYAIAEESETARNDAIIEAIDKGAKVVVCPGYLFAASMYELPNQYPEVMFLGLDISLDDVIAVSGDDSLETYLSSNVTLITYKEEQAGYLAGYAAVKEGFTSLAFLGGMEMPAVTRYGNGFVLGADAAAAEMGIDISMKYWYSGTFLVDDATEVVTDEWCDEGVELIFSCGGNIYVNALNSVTNYGGYLVGVDSDQSSLSELFITSATKDLTTTTAKALSDLYANGGTWPAAYAGKVQNLGASDYCIALPTDGDAWRFENFSIEEYEALLYQIAAQEIVVSDDIENPVVTTNTAVDYQN